MVKLNKIYTKTGDDGTTGLVSGPRRLKSDLRVDAFGSVDETNAVVGISRLHAGDFPALDAMLFRIQNDLFDLGADLATPEHDQEMAWTPLRIVGVQVARIEADIDLLNGSLAPLNSFILPGGSGLAAHLHVARTVCRRAERLMVALNDLPDEAVNIEALKFINRLSDFFFVAARHANDDGRGDVLWVPGATRSI